MKQCLAIIFLSLALKSCGSTNSKDQAQKNAVQWMWAQQSEDGAWHSQTHAVLKDGTVLTPFILFHLLQLPGERTAEEEKKIRKAADFIVTGMRSGISENNNVLKDYPNYSAAYALRVLQQLDRDKTLQKIIADYLIGQQFAGHRGFSPDSLAFGGWGYGEPGLDFGRHGHVDISHTRRISEALQEGGYLDDTIKQSVLLFLKGVQRHPDDPRLYSGCISRKKLPYDGGFVSSVVTLSTTKSQPIQIDSAGMHYPGYATATCDGLMALFAIDKNSEAFADAKQWLLKNQNMHTIDGLSAGDPGQWGEIMHYYHLAVRSEAMSVIDPGGAWKKSIRDILVSEQLPEGYFVNPIGGVNKEDDPLMATILAIQAFANSRS